MAPITLPDDLSLSSLELDSRSSIDTIDIPQYLESLSLSEREALNAPPSSSSSSSSTNIFKRSLPSTDMSPMDLHNILTARTASTATSSTNPGSGSIPPDAINMKGVQAVFALIGASFVVAALWFFFWAKNGGFRFRRGDWDDYKSTVLRRKGPDGKTLSNATKSTKLGGGSVVDSRYRDFDDDETSMGMTEITKTVSGITGLTGGTNLGAGTRIKKMRERMAEKKARKAAATNLKKHMKDTEKRAKKRAVNNSDEPWENGADDDVRAYRHEKPARVGGLNKESDGHGTFYGGTDYSETDTNYTPPPPRHHRSSQSPRYSQSHSRQGSPEKRDRRASRETHHSSQPDYYSSRRTSRQGSPVKTPRRDRSSMPGGFTEPLDLSSDYGTHSRTGETESDTGTKSYHHPIPGLASSTAGGSGGNKGYRRGRRDSLDD